MFSDTWIGREFFLLTCTHTHVLLKLNKAALENSFSNISSTAYCYPVDLKRLFSMQQQHQKERIYQNRLPPPASPKLPQKDVLKLNQVLKLVNNWCSRIIIAKFSNFSCQKCWRTLCKNFLDRSLSYFLSRHLFKVHTSIRSSYAYLMSRSQCYCVL